MEKKNVKFSVITVKERYQQNVDICQVLKGDSKTLNSENMQLKKYKFSSKHTIEMYHIWSNAIIGDGRCAIQPS